MTRPRDRRDVERFFDADVAYWSGVYASPGLDGQIYRRRHQRIVRRIEEINLASGARVLEVGCGAGMLAVALAHRGFDVTATDSSAEMLQAAGEAAARDDVHIGFVRADALALPVPADTFELVAAVGVLPWVSSPRRALAEIARVLKPGGAAVLTSDNLGRLNVALDPRKTPSLGRIRKAVGRRLRSAGLASDAPAVAVSMYRYEDVLTWVTEAGLANVSSETLGFGPVTFFDRRVLGEQASLRLDSKLQDLADRGVAPFARAGAHQLIVARKPV